MDSLRLRLPALALALGLIAGCGTVDQTYSWGRYEALLYDMYRRPGKADPSVQIAQLNEDIERAHGRGSAVPPGVHAHLGYMLYLQGNLAAAQREFETENRLYPESAVLMERLSGRATIPDPE